MSHNLSLLFRGLWAIALIAVFIGALPAADTPINKVKTTSKIVALTFDDGPEPQTLKILEVLKKKNAKATFFMVGNNVKKHPEIAKKVVESGCEIGNHGLTHASLPTLSPAKIREEIVKTQEIIAEAAGVTPKVFRAANLGYNAEVWKVLNELGLPGINSSASVLDWDRKTTEIQIVQRATAATAGCIILMHSWVDKTYNVLPQILDKLQGAGYQVVTVSELLADGAKNAPVIKAVDETLFSENFATYKPGGKIPSEWKSYGKYSFKKDGDKMCLELNGNGGLTWDVPLKPEHSELKFSCRMRTMDVVTGSQNWQDARVAMEFHDAAGKRVGAWPPVAHAVGTTEWKEYTFSLEVPEKAAMLRITPVNFGRSGIVSFADIVVKCTGVQGK